MKYRFSPVFLIAMLLAVMAMFSPAVDIPTVQAQGTPGALVPLGDQLGDVGQYYSQVSPNLNSRTYIYNTAGASRTAVISIYQDSPASGVAYHTVTCDIAANQVLYLGMSDAVSGTLTIEGGSGAGCINGGKAYRGLHHMKIVQSGGGSDLAVSVNAWINVSPDPKQVVGASQAVPSWAVSSEYVLPAVTLYRSLGWDTEIVVQNVSGEEIKVTFEWSLDNESGLRNNNVATLKANERRSFLASQLLYAPAGSGTLAQKEGWTWMKVRGFHPTSGTPKNIAVITNMFKQELTDGKFRAEHGSERFMQFEAPLAGTELFIPGFKVDGSNSYFRVANASTWTSTITARLYNSSGTQVGSTYTNSVDNQKAKFFASSVFGASNGTYTLRIQSSQSVTAAAWYASGGGHTGVTAQRVGDTDGTATYLPFYWENYSSWQDDARWTNTSGSGMYPGNLYKRSDGSSVRSWLFWPWGQYALASTNFPDHNDELYAKLQGSYPLAVGTFENYSTTNDRITSYNGIAKKAGTWYVPFAPAPVVTFTPNDSLFKSVSSWRSRWNGTNGNANFTGWDWYLWDNASNMRSNCSTNSNFMPMHKHPLPHDNSDMGTSNIMPSACAGRPMLLFNEPTLTDWAAGTGRNASDYARLVFYYRNWPGDMSCCGNFEHTGFQDEHNTDGEANQKPWFANINREYTQGFGGTKLPIDGVHMHIYVTLDKVDVTNNVIVSTERTDMGNKLAAWDSYIDGLYGTTFPVVVSEWSIAAGDAANVTHRNQVRSGMVDLARLIKEKLGDHVTEMIWFHAWGANYPYGGARRLIAHGATVDTITDNLSCVGQCYMDIVSEYNDSDGIDWPTSGVCFQDE